MLKQRIIAPSVKEPAAGMWSNCLKVGNQVYISGMTARQSDGETVLGQEYEQSQVIFQKIKDLIEAAGGSLNNIIKMTIFVTNIANNAAVWKARKEFFEGDFPACTLVEVKSLAKPEILLEIEAIAIVA